VRNVFSPRPLTSNQGLGLDHLTILFLEIETMTTEAEKWEKLELLAEIEGYEDAQEMLEAAGCDSVVPAICMSPDCEATAELEPDAENDYCEECGCNTLSSCLIIAGVI
jgi:hypothetical protein